MFDPQTAPATTPDATEEPIPQTQSAAPSVEAPSTEILISEQQVVFSTAAAVGLPRKKISSRLAAILRRMFATSTKASSPRGRYYPKRYDYDYIDDARMAREMDRL